MATWSVHPRRASLLATVLLVSLVALSPALAQGGGSISGRCVSENGEPLAGVEVELVELGLRVTTDSTGAFRFDGIPVGSNDVTFRTADHESSTLSIGILFAGYLRDVGTVTMAGRTASEVGGETAEEDAQSLDPNVLLRGDIVASDATTVDRLIRRLRPRWLRVRGLVRDVGGGSREQVRVYVDGSPRGGIVALETLSTVSIQRIQWVPPRDSRTRYGTGHGAGVIEIYTRRK